MKLTQKEFKELVNEEVKRQLHESTATQTKDSVLSKKDFIALGNILYGWVDDLLADRSKNEIDRIIRKEFSTYLTKHIDFQV